MRRLAAAAIVLALLFAPGAAAPEPKGGKSAGYQQLNLFGEAFDRIRRDAVEPTSDAKLVRAAIAAMLSGLDARSAYLSEEAFKGLRNPANTDEPDIGLVMTIDGGLLKVISPRDGSPAAQAGVKPGDVIFAIGKEPTYELSLSEVEQKLRGPAGSEVELTLRRGSERPSKLKVKREAYQLQTVASHVEAETIGYLRLAGFDGGTKAALAAAVHDLRQRTGNKLSGLIVDLRNNPGGNFEAAVAAADAFIDKGDIAVVKGRKADNAKRIAATAGDLAKGLPIVVLVNGGTAGEAELVAGALQDNHRAVLLGTKSFGQSAIESVIPLGSGGAIRLTTARYTTPTGREIQGKGLDPDLTVTPLKLEKLAQGDRRREADLRGALKNTDPAGTSGEQRPALAPSGNDPKQAPSIPGAIASGAIGSADDEQLTAAVDVLRGLSLAGRMTP